MEFSFLYFIANQGHFAVITKMSNFVSENTHIILNLTINTSKTLMTKLTLLSDRPESALSYKDGHNIVFLQMIKAIIAFGVVAIHVGQTALTEPITRVCIPIFFMITGYFLLNKDGILTTNRLKRTFIKIFKIALGANIFYFLIYLLAIVLNHPDKTIEICHKAASISTIASIGFWLKTILIGQNLCISLWYLTALLEALIVLYLCVKFNLYKLLPYLAIIGLILNFAIGEFHLFGHFDASVHRNFLTITIPGLYIGMLIRLNEHRINISKNKLIGMIILSIALLYIERAHFPDGKFVIMSIPTAIAVFIFAIKNSTKNDNWIATIGEKHSKNIYIYHLFIFQCFTSLNILIPHITALEIYVASIIFSILLIGIKKVVQLSQKMMFGLGWN